MESARNQIERIVSDAAVSIGFLEVPAGVRLSTPSDEAHGDLATNFALVVSRTAEMSPKQLAEKLRDAILAHPATDDLIERVEVAPRAPFVNFYLLPRTVETQARRWLDLKPNVEPGSKGSIHFEFVSANPTGPLTVGNGWWLPYGDSVRRLLQRSGYRVHSEYYVNDVGNQIRNLGKSIIAQRKGLEIPDDGYKGDYVFGLGKTYLGPNNPDEAGAWAAQAILRGIKNVLVRARADFDQFFHQSDLEKSGLVEEIISKLAVAGASYEKEGAVWFRATDFGDSRDRVLRRSDGGEVTYFAADLAYHYDKLVIRGFERSIDILGADHRGHEPTLRAGLKALEIDDSRLEILIGQMVALEVGEGENRAAVKMSKRAGTFVEMQKVLGRIGVDETRALSLWSGSSHSRKVNLDAVFDRTSQSPIGDVKYAIRRVVTMKRFARENGFVVGPKSLANADWSLLVAPEERNLMKWVGNLDDVLDQATEKRAPHEVLKWAVDASHAFHSFYHTRRVIGAERETGELINPDLSRARLALVVAFENSLKTGLGVLGIDGYSPPTTRIAISIEDGVMAAIDRPERVTASRHGVGIAS